MSFRNTKAWVIVEQRQGLRSADVRGTRKRGMGREWVDKVPGAVASSLGISLVTKNLVYMFGSLIDTWGTFLPSFTVERPLKGRLIVFRGGYFGERRLWSLSGHAGKAHGFIHECKHAYKI